jgi:pimeloyl-ACP methyl ester carboxylesterase
MDNILLLHGWGVGSKTWVNVKNILESYGYKVFVPDLPGFGENPEPRFPWSVDDYAEWVADFCAKNNLSHFFLFGHSFGGGIATLFTAKYPDKVIKLGLIAAKLHRQKTIRYYGGIFLAKVGNFVFCLPFLSFLRPLAQKILYKLLGVRDYYKLELKKTFTMKETFRKVVDYDLTPYLPKIKTPTLIIWGTKDSDTPLGDAYLINKEIAGSKLELIDGGRHALNLQYPEKVAESIDKFVKSN